MDRCYIEGLRSLVSFTGVTILMLLPAIAAGLFGDEPILESLTTWVGACSLAWAWVDGRYLS